MLFRATATASWLGIGLAAAIHAGPSGRVIDASGAPVTGAMVEWIGPGLHVRTDSGGRFAFPDPEAAAFLEPPPVEAAAGAEWRLEGTRLHLTLARGAALEIDRVDAAGREWGRGNPFRKVLGAGRHTLDLESLAGKPQAASAVWMRLRAGRDSRWFRMASLGGGWTSLSMVPGAGGPPGAALRKSSAASDSLRISLEGFLRRDVAWPDEGGRTEILLKRGLDFASHYPGSGLVEDIASGQTLRLPPGRRIQVVLVSEGYTRADLDAGRFRRDVEAWMRDVFALEPLGAFKEAFSVWTWPAPAPARLPRAGEADQGNSPFRLKVAAGAVQEPGPGTVSEVWKLMRRLPQAPWGWYPSGGLTHRQARNAVVQILALDPSTGRAGYSGLARRMADPSDSRRAVNVAIGQEQQHEFMHALANLVDEYHDSTRAPLGSFSLENESRYFTNASSSRDCGKLPWRHLLPGGPINPGPEGLIGAFGQGGRYHPELKCLMNGTHHNAALYGGDGYLRLRGRLCNLCREIALFRIYERTGILPDAARSLAAWEAAYRPAFFRKFPFHAPAVLPQRNSSGTAVFLPCGAGDGR